MLQGLGIGLLVSLLFSLVPLLDVRHVKPSLLLRDEARPRRLDVTQIVVTVLVVAGLVGLTVWQAGSLRIGARGGRRLCGDGDRAAPRRQRC